MSHKHQATIQALFAHPVSANIDPREVKAALESLGAEITHGGHGHLIVKLGGHTHGFHDSHHSLSKDEVVGVRKFLEAAGVTAAV